MKKNVLLQANIFICAIIISGFTALSLTSYRFNRQIFDRDIECISALAAREIERQIGPAQIQELEDVLSSCQGGCEIRAYLADSEGTLVIPDGGADGNKARFIASKILDCKGDSDAFWYTFEEQSGYLVIRRLPGLCRYLVVDYDSSGLTNRLRGQLALGITVIVLMIGLALFAITGIVGHYNRQLIESTVAQVKKHRSVFQAETEKIYESIYEIDVTHDRAADEATENYFENMGVPKNTPYGKALHAIAQKQVKEEYRQGYISTFSPDNVLREYENGVETLQFDFMITNDDGQSYYWIRTTARIFYWDDDRSVRMFVYHQNIDEQKRQEKMMIEKLERDSMTGLYNKAATQKYMQLLLREDPVRMYAFFIFDIDDFKQVNDTCGHAMGDLVVAGFAKLLKDQFRADDIVGRIGGDEFVVLVPVPSEEFAEQKAQSLVAALHHEFHDGAKRRSVTTSIGIAFAPEAGADFEALYRNADCALYRTKERGRNGYTVYRP